MSDDTAKAVPCQAWTDTFARAMQSLKARIDAVADATGFSGVVRIDRSGTVELEEAYGLADRAYGIPNAPDTMFAIASGSKAFTALAVMSLVEDGTLGLDTTARALLGDDLPLIADDVAVEHLLAHRSGIGDYLDEEGDDDVNELHDAGLRARARDDRAIRGGARRPRDGLPRRRAVRV